MRKSVVWYLSTSVLVECVAQSRYTCEQFIS